MLPVGALKTWIPLVFPVCGPPAGHDRLRAPGRGPPGPDLDGSGLGSPGCGPHLMYSLTAVSCGSGASVKRASPGTRCCPAPDLPSLSWLVAMKMNGPGMAPACVWVVRLGAPPRPASRWFAGAGPAREDVDLLLGPGAGAGHGAGLQLVEDGLGVLADIVMGPQVKGKPHRLAVIGAEQRPDVLLETDGPTGGWWRGLRLIHLRPLLILGHRTIMPGPGHRDAGDTW
jgi:hypothetical protein